MSVMNELQFCSILSSFLGPVNGQLLWQIKKKTWRKNSILLQLSDQKWFMVLPGNPLGKAIHWRTRDQGMWGMGRVEDDRMHIRPQGRPWMFLKYHKLPPWPTLELDRTRKCLINLPPLRFYCFYEALISSFIKW